MQYFKQNDGKMPECLHDTAFDVIYADGTIIKRTHNMAYQPFWNIDPESPMFNIIAWRYTD